MSAVEIHPYWLVVTAFSLSLVPTFFALTTSYVKVSIVFGLLRSALGTQQAPSGMVVMALSAALSLFIMQPVFTATFEKAQLVELKSLEDKPRVELFKIGADLIGPWREFLEKHTGRREISLLLKIQANRDNKESSAEKVKSEEIGALLPAQLSPTPITILLPAFLLSELKQAFSMGFTILLPFLIIDLVVGNVLAGMGLMMMSPALVSLPLKLLVFVLSDGWLLIVRGLVASYGAH